MKAGKFYFRNDSLTIAHISQIEDIVKFFDVWLQRFYIFGRRHHQRFLIVEEYTTGNYGLIEMQWAMAFANNWMKTLSVLLNSNITCSFEFTHNMNIEHSELFLAIWSLQIQNKTTFATVEELEISRFLIHVRIRFTWELRNDCVEGEGG